MSSQETIEQTVDEIEHLVEELELPEEVSNFAQMVIKQWDNKGRLQSRPVRINAGAAVIVACKNAGLPFTTRDVATNLSGEVNSLKLTGKEEEVEKPRKYIGRAETDMISTLGLEASIATPEDYVDRFCDNVGVDENIVDLTYQVLETAQRGDSKLFSGRSPSAGTAAAIWIASRLAGREVTQSDVASVAETSTVTVRNMANSIVIALLQSDTSVDDMMETEEIDARLNQRISKSKKQLEV